MQNSSPDKYLPGHFFDAEVEGKGFVLFITDKYLLLWGKMMILPLKRPEGRREIIKKESISSSHHCKTLQSKRLLL